MSGQPRLVGRQERAKALLALKRQLRSHHALLRTMAARYTWWKTPEEALRFPQRIVAQVMNLGTFEDFMAVNRQLGDDCLRQVLATAEAGQLNPRSWHYWHYRLNQVNPGDVPPLPRRHIA